jgi:methylated-DNA-[protein]-cysteine S-methyltransferase
MSAPQTDRLFYAVWPTAWGAMGAVAGPRGLRRVVLPHYQRKDLQDLLAWEHPQAVCDAAPFEALIRATGEYFNARPVDFSAIPVDLPGQESFFGKVYRACRAVLYGRRRSYRELALAIGNAEAARAVAAALGKNPTPLVVPCHRITYSGGGLGGFSAEGGVALKGRLLALEAGPPP